MNNSAILIIAVSAVAAAPLLACSGGSGLYDPISVAEIESGKVAPGLAELDAHVAILGSIRCYPQSKPTHCFYRAVAPDSDAARRQAAGETVEIFDSREHQSVLVRMKPGADKDPDFAHRPKSQGRFTRIAMLDYEDQKAFVSLNVDLRMTMLYQPDTGDAGILGSWGKLTLPIFVAVAAALAGIAYLFVRASRGGDTDPAKYAPERPFGGPSRSIAPRPAPPSDRISGAPPASSWRPSSGPAYGSAALSQPPPGPSSKRPPRLSLAPGSLVVITRASGARVYGTFVREVDGRCLCEVEGSGKEWLAAEQVKANG